MTSKIFFKINYQKNFSRFSFFCANLIFLFGITNMHKVISNEIINEPTIDYLNRKSKNKFYILGPGDKISIRGTKLESDLDENIYINSDGTTNTNRLKNIYVSGLTIDELTSILNKKYSEFILNPDVLIKILEHRPIKVYIDGEVEEPGFHYLPGSFNAKDYADYFNLKSNVGNLGNIIDLEGGTRSTAIKHYPKKTNLMIKITNLAILYFHLFTMLLGKVEV